MSNFSKKAKVGSPTPEGFEKEDKPFVRDDSDNKMFPQIQVKDIKEITTEDCNAAYDADTLIYQACSNVENKFIRVTHKEDKNLTEELKNITAFRGMGKKIAPKSWLGAINTERELEGLEPYTADDFEVEEAQKLKYDTEAQAIERAKIAIFTKLKDIKQQFGINKITLVLGEGDNFRHELPLCRKYKGQRKPSARPIILDKVRKWAVEHLEALIAAPRWDEKSVEADDVVEYYGNIGYQHYKKTGKFNWLVIASDKDSMNNPKLLVNPDKHSGEGNPLRGRFKQPQAMLIKDSIADAGDIDFKAKANGVDYKFYGFKGLLWQAFLSGDGADNYNCLSHLGQKLNFGDESAYKVLKPCKTAKEALQATIDVFAEVLPYGVQYTDCHGVDHDVDCMTYMDAYFKVAYMLRHDKDKMDFYTLCNAFKVDTSKIVGNNRYTPPKSTFVGEKCEESVNNLKGVVEEVLCGDLKAYKSLKKGDLVERMDNIKNTLEKLLPEFGKFYEMQQFLKEGFEED